MTAWTIAAVAVGATLALVGASWLAVRAARRHPTLRRVLALPARGKLSLARSLLASPEVPLVAKLALPALVAYLAMPFDLVPDFIPVVGYADDVLAIAATLALVLRLTPPHVVERLLDREEARARADRGSRG